MRSDFYHEMGWDPGTGYPTAERIADLGIEVMDSRATDTD
jgi:aldehyde:ferredoxin oxidoreductase